MTFMKQREPLSTDCRCKTLKKQSLCQLNLFCLIKATFEDLSPWKQNRKLPVKQELNTWCIQREIVLLSESNETTTELSLPRKEKGIMERHASAYSFKQLQIFLMECYTLLSVSSSSVCTTKSKRKSFIHDSQHPKDPPFLTGSDSQDSRRYYQTHGWLCPTGANSLKSLPHLPVSFPQHQQYAGE